jgi:hypothetical protein
MKSKEITIEQERRYILIMDKHDEVIAELVQNLAFQHVHLPR